MLISSSKMFSNLQWATIFALRPADLVKIAASLSALRNGTRAHSVMVLLHSLPPPPLLGPQISGLREETRPHSVVAKVRGASVPIM